MIREDSAASPTEPAPVVLEPSGRPRALVVWLHGLGADGHDFVPVARELGLAERGARVVLPHAPSRPVTVNGGYVMPAWYDLLGMDLAAREDANGIRESAVRITALLAQYGEDVEVERRVLAGFSQGGAVALYAGLVHAGPLAGIIALSAYLPLAETLAAEAPDPARCPPIFMGHGEQDPVVPLDLALRSSQHLAALGCRVELHRYAGMPHAVSPEELRDLGRWLGERGI